MIKRFTGLAIVVLCPFLQLGCSIAINGAEFPAVLVQGAAYGLAGVGMGAAGISRTQAVGLEASNDGIRKLDVFHVPVLPDPENDDLAWVTVFRGQWTNEPKPKKKTTGLAGIDLPALFLTVGGVERRGDQDIEAGFMQSWLLGGFVVERRGDGEQRWAVLQLPLLAMATEFREPFSLFCYKKDKESTEIGFLWLFDFKTRN